MINVVHNQQCAVRFSTVCLKSLWLSSVFLCHFAICVPVSYSDTYMNSVPQSRDKVRMPSSPSENRLPGYFFQGFLHNIGRGEAEY